MAGGARDAPATRGATWRGYRAAATVVVATSVRLPTSALAEALTPDTFLAIGIDPVTSHVHVHSLVTHDGRRLLA